MKIKEALKVMYGIEDTKVLNRLSELQKYVFYKWGKEWSPLFIVDILYAYLSKVDISNEDIDNHVGFSFGRKIELVLNSMSNDEILELIDKYLNSNQKTKAL